MSVLNLESELADQVLQQVLATKKPRKSRAKEPCHTTLEQELRVALAEDRAKNLHLGIRGKLWCVEPTSPDGTGSWSDLAQSLSLYLPGQFWVGSNSICWVNGGSPAWYLAPYERLPSIKEARAICQELTGLPEEKVPCSSAGCARKMLEWVNITQTTRRALDFIGAKDCWQYQYCNPVDLALGYLWDITACYYSLLCRAPSPKVLWLNNQLYWCPVERDELTRWKKMLEAAGPHKGIRNSFIGQMYASSDGLYFSKGRPNKNYYQEIEYHRAEDGVTLYQTGLQLDHQLSLDERQKEEEKQAKPGPLRPLASLIVRSAAELCSMAKEEENGLYAKVDCVITASQHSPKVWGRYGLKVALKGVGPTSIYALGYYQVGEYKTEHVRNAEKREAQGKPSKRPRKPHTDHNIKVVLAGRRWCDEWLASDCI